MSEITNRRIAITDLELHPDNYRRHPAGQIERLRNSLRTFGQPRSIVAWERGEGLPLQVVAGNGLTMAAQAEGWDSLRADIIPSDWTPERVKAYLIADNRLAELSEDDPAQLLALLDEIHAADPKLQKAAGYEEEEKDELIRSIIEEIGDNRTGKILDYPTADLKSPYPYFGGKRKIAGLVWAKFGDVGNYVEPFFGSGAVLLRRPHVMGKETINDLDGFVANFWRAVRDDPDAVAHHVDWPTNETDLFSRHMWLVRQGPDLTAKMNADPEYYDPKIAGWWCWGASNWLGSEWCTGRGSWQVEAGVVEKTGAGVKNQKPFLSGAGQGTGRQIPHLGNAGQGINRQIPEMAANRGINRHDTAGQCQQWAEHLAEYMGKLSDRLRRVRVISGDWKRATTHSVTNIHGLTGIFLDPPYAAGAMEYAAKGNADASLIAEVRSWAIRNGENPDMRIALCGYDLEMPPGWEGIRWTGPKGYNTDTNQNREREIVWFSPHCLPTPEPTEETDPEEMED